MEEAANSRTFWTHSVFRNAVSYAVMNGGIAAGVAWWVTGIPFDLLHGAGNFVVALLLYKPLRYCLQRAKQLGPQA